MNIWPSGRCCRKNFLIVPAICGGKRINYINKSGPLSSFDSGPLFISREKLSRLKLVLVSHQGYHFNIRKFVAAGKLYQFDEESSADNFAAELFHQTN